MSCGGDLDHEVSVHECLVCLAERFGIETAEHWIADVLAGLVRAASDPVVLAHVLAALVDHHRSPALAARRSSLRSRHVPHRPSPVHCLATRPIPQPFRTPIPAIRDVPRPLLEPKKVGCLTNRSGQVIGRASGQVFVHRLDGFMFAPARAWTPRANYLETHGAAEWP